MSPPRKVRLGGCSELAKGFEPHGAPQSGGVRIWAHLSTFPVDTRTALRALQTRLAEAGAGTAVEIYGAAGSLGPALAARLAGPSPLLYLVAQDDQVHARAADLGFFLPTKKASDDPLQAPPVLDFPAPEVSPHAETQPDRRTTMRRLAVLYRLGHGHAPTIVVASAAAAFRRVMVPHDFAGLCRTVKTHMSLDRQILIDDLYRAG